MKKFKSQKSAKEKEPQVELAGKSAGEDFLIVGLGASAGGIQALKVFFENVTADSGMAYVVILHLSPDHDSRLAEVLQTVARIPVAQVTQRVKVEPNRVYVVPPNEHLTMLDGEIEVSPNLTIEERRAPVDIFFRTLAESHDARAVCVVLSGTGANGSMGLKRIKEKGGVCFVQNPREAEFSEMPRNAIATDLVDRILNVAEIPAHVLAYKESLGTVEIPVEAESRPEQQQQALREIFTQLRTRTGHDFFNYKRPTILRRIERRINVGGLQDLPAYAAFVRENAGETTALLKDLLISVTNFFRDKAAFDFFETDVLPKILRGKTGEDQLRIWVAGCATGEEAYSLAMLCAERTTGAGEAPEVQIFASDIDEQAIGAAREGFYTLNDAADVSPERLRRFFTKENDGYRIRRELRETVLFANHNVLKDPPFSRLDLVTCRNMLIYLNHTAQERVMETFHFALEPGGFLFLGNSETVDGASDLYAAISKEHRIYQSRHVSSRIVYPIADSSNRYAGARLVRAASPRKSLPAATEESEPGAPLQRISFGDLHLRLLEQYAPSVVVNEEYDIVHLSSGAARFLQMKAGEPTQNLLKLILPELRLELRTALYQAVERQTNVEIKNLKIKVGERSETLDIFIRPVPMNAESEEQHSAFSIQHSALDSARGFVLVLFEPARESSRSGEENGKAVYSSAEPIAGQLEEELLRTKTRLRTSAEQYEIQAEELKASNEELQALNEELRSSSEELETSKEELQSVNEELVTVNQELKIKIEEITQTNNDFQNLINSTDIATIFLDRSFRVNSFTPAATRLFNLIAADTGRPLSDITHRLESDGLLDDAETVLENLQTIEREIKSTDNRVYSMRVLPYRTAEDRIGGIVLTFFDVTERKRADELVRLSEERLQQAINIETVGVIFFDNNIEIIDCNDAFLRMTGFTREEIRAGKFGWEQFTPAEFVAPSRRAIEELNRQGFTTPYEKEYVRKDGSRFWGLFSCRRVSENESVEFVSDITAQKLAQEALRESEARLHFALDAAQMGTFLYRFAEDRGEPDARMLALFGLSADDTISLAAALAEMIHPDDRARYAEAVARAADSGGDGLLNEEIRVVHSDRSVHWIVITGQTIFAGEQPRRASLMYGVAADITERKRAEEALRESEAKYRTLFDSIDEGFCLIEVLFDEQGKAADYRFLEMNPVFERQSGLENASGKTILELVPDLEPQWAETYARVARTGEAVRFEADVHAMNRVFDIYAFPANAPATVAVLFSDITERKQTDTHLRESETRLRLAVEAGELGTWEWNLKTDEVIWNDRHFRLFGLEPQPNPLKSEMFFKYVHPDDRDPVGELLRQAVRDKAVFDTDFRAVLESGETRWMSGYGRVTEESADDAPLKMSGVMFDINDRKQVEQALRESEERLRLLIESAANYAIFTMKINGEIDSWNKGAEKIFGWTETEAVGESGAIIFTPEDRAKLEPEKEMKAALRTGSAPDERFHLRQDGTRFYVSGVMTVLRDASGTARGFVKIARDMTERLEAEKNAHDKEMLQKLVGAQEDERRRIARDLHDELGQQLTALRLKLDIARRICRDDDVCAAIDEMEQIARGIDNGVDFLAWELRPAALDQLGLIAALENYVRQWSHHSGVSAELLASSLKRRRFAPEVETNLYRIVQEALNNVHKHAKANNVEVLLEKRDDLIVLIVQDNGRGFNPNGKKQRLKGIGLIGMQERAALLKGTLEIESAPGAGATVFVRVPISSVKKRGSDGK